MIFAVNIRVIDSRPIKLFTSDELAADLSKKNPGPDDPKFEGSMLIKTIRNAKGSKIEMDDIQNFKCFTQIPPGEHAAEIFVGAYGGKNGPAIYVRILKILKTKQQA